MGMSIIHSEAVDDRHPLLFFALRATVRGLFHVRSQPRGLGQMANRAGVQRAGMPLQLDELDRVVGFAAGRDSVCAVVAGLAVYAAMPL